MSEAEKILYSKSKIEKEIGECNEQIGRYQEEYDKIEEMIRKVELWQEPTPEHLNLKNFMLSQLNESIDNRSDDSYQNRINDLINTDYLEFYKNVLECQKDSLEYYEKRCQKELDQCKSRRDWLVKLIESVGDPQ